MKHKETFNPGIGPTNELSLRVSVATLVRVLFEHPKNGDLMLALERKATLRETESGRVVEIKSQPFGGAIRILDPGRMGALVGDFHFDSERSRIEQDFRLFIRPSNWPALREFCLQHISREADPILETDPGRELAEEFAGAMKIDLKPEQYLHKPVATVVENDPSPTENIHAQGFPTARVYRIFEARILDPALAHAMTTNSESLSVQDLREMALEDAQHGGKGRLNAILALPLKRVTGAYIAVSPNERNAPITFAEHRLDETVGAVLEAISVPKYRRL
jgi:hypothetical protein